MAGDIPNEREALLSRLLYFSRSPWPRTTTSRSAEKRSYRAFLMSGRYRETTISFLKSVGI